MTPAEINLTNCDKEPIVFLGKIQSYGFLVTASIVGEEIRNVSNNIGDFLPVRINDILGKPLNHLSDYIGFSDSSNLFDFCKNSVPDKKADMHFPPSIVVQIGEKPFYLVVNQTEDLLILEFQPVTYQDDITTKVFNLTSKILASNTLEEVFHNSATEIKSLIDYDRVMVYKFLPDGSGEVVGEAINDNMESFMHQRYPESDIPRQARALYKLNRIRLIADVNSETVDIMGKPGAGPFDMTYCTLRAVSPTHILYCKNMGLGSSFSISIIIQNELWGLITCHNNTAKHIDYNIRQAAMLLNNLISIKIFNKTSEINKLLENHFQKKILQLQYNLSVFDSVAAALTSDDTNLQHVTNADGVALLYGGKAYLMGETPAKEQVKKLAKWAQNVVANHIFVTNELARHYITEQNFYEKASGVVIASLGNENNDLIIWFKKENIKTILWAGEPKKGIIPDENVEGGKIVPRTSFKVFREIVGQTSDEWHEEEINAVRRITQAVRDIAFKKAQEQNATDLKLKMAYDELDSFTYTVSHDLKNPLGVIKTYAQFLVHSNIVNDEKGKSIINKIVSGSDKLTQMLQSLLELSKMSRQEIGYEQVDMDELIKNILNEQLLTGDYSHTKVSLGDLPAIKGNPLLVYHIFSNIISNAFKYSSQHEKPLIKIKGYKNGTDITYEVEDNGIGMAEETANEAFKLFKRLSNATEYEGTGAGLAIVKKNIEKLGGRVFFKSGSEGGTIFYLIFCNQEK